VQMPHCTPLATLLQCTWQALLKNSNSVEKNTNKSKDTLKSYHNQTIAVTPLHVTALL